MIFFFFFIKRFAFLQRRKIYLFRSYVKRYKVSSNWQVTKYKKNTTLEYESRIDILLFIPYISRDIVKYWKMQTECITCSKTKYSKRNLFDQIERSSINSVYITNSNLLAIDINTKFRPLAVTIVHELVENLSTTQQSRLTFNN